MLNGIILASFSENLQLFHLIVSLPHLYSASVTEGLPLLYFHFTYRGFATPIFLLQLQKVCHSNISSSITDDLPLLYFYFSYRRFATPIVNVQVTNGLPLLYFYFSYRRFATPIVIIQLQMGCHSYISTSVP